MGGKNEEEHALTVLKTISDPTRYQILSLLNQTTYYGQELADRLELSLATISHHMELLVVGAKVVKMELSGNKAYYKLNREELAKCLMFLKNKFGLEL
jgi:DNA-binding transcriptional ArsR family regulator